MRFPSKIDARPIRKGFVILPLARMKAKTKWTIASCVAASVCFVGFSMYWTSIPYKKLRDLDARYTIVSQGMSRDEVINVMQCNDYRNYQGAAVWWDDERLGSEADTRVSTAIRYTIRTFYLPVTFEFTFDEYEKIVGRHRFD